MAHRLHVVREKKHKEVPQMQVDHIQGNPPLQRHAHPKVYTKLRSSVEKSFFFTLSRIDLTKGHIDNDSAYMKEKFPTSVMPL